MNDFDIFDVSTYDDLESIKYFIGIEGTDINIKNLINVRNFDLYLLY